MTYSNELDIRVTDSSLRDGSHAKVHQFVAEQVRAIAAGLDEKGVPVIEVTHGDGLAGASYNYGFSLINERDLISEAVSVVKRAKIAALLLPGIGTVEDMRAVHDLGVSVIRIATHATEADISIQHFGLARDLGFETVGFLMMAHSVQPEKLAEQAKIMAEAGCQCVYVVDSAGALILEQVSERVQALRAALPSEVQVGFHGHQNLGLGVSNSILAIRAGAVQIDSCTRSFGAGAGNTPTEVLVAVCERLGIKTGIDVFGMLDFAEEVVRPIEDAEPAMDRLSIMMGFAGVYSSFLRHAFRAAERCEVPGAEILRRAGERRLVGGQEDMLIDIAVEIQSERKLAGTTH